MSHVLGAPRVRSRRLTAPVGAVLIAIALALGMAAPATAAPTPPAPMALGLVGPYDANVVQAAAAAGISTGLVEMQWSLAEPAPGVFDLNYLRGVAAAVALARGAGYQVSLNTGIQSAPAWLLNLPGGRFVNQAGQVYTGQAVPNLVFGTALRPFAQAYLNVVFKVLGTGFTLVRTGGGMYGELSYPYTFNAQNLVTNSYWAFDINANRRNPVPGWKPGQASPRGEAGTFLTWYLNALVNYQNWQITALRNAGYSGDAAVLYPSYGMRDGDFAKAVAGNLSGSSSAEINGEVQRGYDMARQVKALVDTRAVVYGTWAENLPVLSYLAGLARSRGLKVMGENAGPNTQAVMDAMLRNAQANGVSALYLVRAPDLMAGGPDRATLAQIGATYRAMRAAA